MTTPEVPALAVPEVSVITPVFDRAHCVEDAVRSVLAQTRQDIEHILVDDGSSDASLDLLQGLAREDDRVRVFTQDHGGPSAARNLALANARAPFVTFLDSDDLMPVDRIERQLRYLEEHPDADAVMGVEELVFEAGIEPPAWTQIPTTTPRHCWITTLISLEHLRRLGGFDEALWYGEDTDLSFRLREERVRVDAIDEVFLFRRFFGDNLAYTQEDRAQDLLAGVRRHLDRSES